MMKNPTATSVSASWRAGRTVLQLLVPIGVLACTSDGLIGPSDPPGAARRLGLAVDNGLIAFEATRTGHNQIFVMNPDGSGQTNLTNTVSDDQEPEWSPDATQIAFASSRDDGNDDIFVMNADGSGQTNLTNTDDFEFSPTWSPDASQIAFETFRDSDGNTEIYVMNAADGGGQTNLTNHAGEDFTPDWSPDGTQIAFTSSRDGNFEIYVMNADGSGQTRLTDNAAFEFGPAWSPDGTRIAFTSDRDGNREVYVMNADGSAPTRLTDNAASDQQAAWSPDGNEIAFSSFRDGNFEIYVMGSDGSNPTRLTNEASGDHSPSWGPAVDGGGAEDSYGTAVGDGDIQLDADSDRPGTRSRFNFLLEGGDQGNGPAALQNGDDYPRGELNFLSLGNERRTNTGPVGADDIRFQSYEITLVQVDMGIPADGTGQIYAEGEGELTEEGVTEGGWRFCLYAEDNAPRGRRFKDNLDLMLYDSAGPGSCENPDHHFKGQKGSGDIDAQDDGSGGPF